MHQIRLDFKQKLSEVISFIPAGIVDKTHTGIGATTLELDCNRDSIVVEPLVTTAYEKSLKPSKNNKTNIFFYGNKVDGPNKRKIVSSDSYFLLSVYLKQQEENNQRIKITCVADQLCNLKNDLSILKPGAFENCHLMLDEIDFMQDSSSFRSSMDECILVYKNHDSTKRTLISATLSKFHDPDLINEPLTTIVIDNIQKTELRICEIDEEYIEIVSYIKELLDANPDEKIVLALNHIDLIHEVINNVLKEDILKTEDISVLCSKSRAHELLPYSNLRLNNGHLSGKLTILTSAYFNGFDILDQYHNIMLGDGISPTLNLSPAHIFQISGRCRHDNGLLSNTFFIKIRHYNLYKKFPLYTAEELVKNNDVITELNALIKKVSEIETKYALKINDVLYKAMINNTEFTESVYIKDESTRELSLSYLKVDHVLEKQQTRELYSDIKTMISKLEEKFNIKSVNFDRLSMPDISEQDLAKSLLHTVSLLSAEAKKNVKPERTIKFIKSTIAVNSKVSKAQVPIFNIYYQCIANSKLDFDLAAAEITNILNNKKQYLKQLKKLEVYVKLVSLNLTNTDNKFKSAINTTYTPGSWVNKEVLVIKNESLFHVLQNELVSSKEEKDLLQTILRYCKRGNNLHEYLVSYSVKKTSGLMQYQFSDTPIYAIQKTSI